MSVRSLARRVLHARMEVFRCDARMLDAQSGDEAEEARRAFHEADRAWAGAHGQLRKQVAESPGVSAEDEVDLALRSGAADVGTVEEIRRRLIPERRKQKQ